MEIPSTVSIIEKTFSHADNMNPFPLAHLQQTTFLNIVAIGNIAHDVLNFMIYLYIFRRKYMQIFIKIKIPYPPSENTVRFPFWICIT